MTGSSRQLLHSAPACTRTRGFWLETPRALVAELRDLLGARLVAYLGGVRETRAVRQWPTARVQCRTGPMSNR